MRLVIVLLSSSLLWFASVFAASAATPHLSATAVATPGEDPVAAASRVHLPFPRRRSR
jgi:hypothetical protein